MNRILPLLLLPLLLLAAACSTTSALPDDEQLYTGIQTITYADDPVQLRKQKGRDSTGVITAVAQALEAVNHALEGKASPARDSLRQGTQALTKQQQKALKVAQARNEADFAVAREEVEAVLAYPPNNAIFGSSSMSWPWQIGLWVHNGLADSKGALGKWMYRTFGTEPVLLSQVSPDMRTKVATNTLHNYGYFHGKVDFTVLPQKNPKKAKVSYRVEAGQLFRLDSVAYLHYPAPMDSLLRAHRREGLLRRGDAFSVVNLSNEQTRIESLLRNHGYYFYNAGYTTFRADTLQRKHFVQLQVIPVADRPERADRPWYIGRTYVTVRHKDNAPLTGQLVRRSYTYQYSGRQLPLRPNMWRHAISHRRGELYSLEDQKLTLEKLGAMGVLSQMDVAYVPRDTSATCDTLDIVVTAVMDKLYDSTFEMNATMKSNQQVGPGLSYELAKRNAFRGGEKVSFKIFGSYEWQTGAGSAGSNPLLNSYEIGTQLALRFPRVVFPGISRRRVRHYATTQFSLDADWKNRSNFFNMVSFGLGATYHWYKRETSQHELTLFNLEFDKLNHTTPAFDSIMQANPALYVSMRDQFVPSLTYTFTYQSRTWRSHPWWVQLSFKEAGNLTSLGYALAGQQLSHRGKKLFGNPFAQYVKFTAEAHKLFKFTPGTKLAARLFGGIVYSYGNSNAVPYNDQFYVGGANSIRAFTVRSVGPGRYKPGQSRYSYMDQTGDVKLEANVELRTRLMGDLHGAVFLDAGNVWTLRADPQRPGSQLTASTLTDLAVGTGFGLRYDMQFLVLRFDVGIALHAPYETSKSGFYNIERFKDGLGLHFAIGYPF
ncbi:MAG: BamA/TamA family outer membrane protein [Alloprevotella sp.]